MIFRKTALIKPEKDQIVLTYDGDETDFTKYCDGRWCCIDDLNVAIYRDGSFWLNDPDGDYPFALDDVTFWLPVPKPSDFWSKL